MSRHDIENIHTMLSTRGRFLRSLLGNPLQKSELAAEVGVSARTAARAIRDLERANLVRRTPAGYCATLCGVFAEAEHTAHHQRLAAIDNAAPVISALPIETPLTAAVVDGADVRVGTPSTPDEPVRQAYNFTRDATHLQTLAPVTLSQSVDVYHDRLMNHEVTIECVCSSALVKTLTSVYAQQFTEALRSAGADLQVYESNRALPFRLFIAEGQDGRRRMGIAVRTANSVHGTITNDTTEAITWAENLYEEYRRDAIPLTNPIDSS